MNLQRIINSIRIDIIPKDQTLFWVLIPFETWCGQCSSCCISFDDKFIVAGLHNGTLKMWNLQKCCTSYFGSSPIIQIFEGKYGKINCCCFTSTNEILKDDPI